MAAKKAHVKRKKIAVGGVESRRGVFIRKRDAFGANLEVHCTSQAVAKKKYLNMKLANLLFPEHFPRPVGVVRDVVHTRYVAPHRELRECIAPSTESLSSRQQRTLHNALSKAFDPFERQVDALNRLLEETGILVDTYMTNVGLRGGKITFYDVDVIDSEKVLSALDRLRISEQRRRAARKFLAKHWKEL